MRFKKGQIPWNKGKEFSEEHKKNISIATKIAMQDPEKRKKLSDALKKRIRTNEYKNKMSKIAKKNGFGKWMIGKKRTITTKNKQSLSLKKAYEEGRKKSVSLRGEKSWGWKGGITPLVRSVRTLKQMKDWSRTILKRDLFTCLWCKKRGGLLSADHIKMFSRILQQNNIKTIEDALNCKELWDLNNGQTLCKECHIWKTKMDNFIYRNRKMTKELNIV